MSRNCHCNVEEVKKGHRRDCPLNKEFAPRPVPVRKPFEEMDREEMIVAHAALRADLAQYVAELHTICRLGIKIVNYTKELDLMPPEFHDMRDKLIDLLGFNENQHIKP
jgi:hypothetical protein